MPHRLGDEFSHIGYASTVTLSLPPQRLRMPSEAHPIQEELLKKVSRIPPVRDPSTRTHPIAEELQTTDIWILCDLAKDRILRTYRDEVITS